MKDLITVSQTKIGAKEVQAVSARELYLGLGLASDKWARWSETNVVENEYFMEGIDFIKLDIMSSSPNPPKGVCCIN